MSETIAWEGNLLLVSILLGICLMLSYDVLRIIRNLVRHPYILLAIEDGIYWILCGISIFAMLYQENDGLLRWFVLAGIVLGMLIENSWVSPWLVKICTIILEKIGFLLKKLWDVPAKPGKKFFRILRKELKKIGKAFKIGLCKM